MANFDVKGTLSVGSEEMTVNGILTAAGTRMITIYENFASPKETGSINFPDIALTHSSGIVCFIARVYNNGWTNAQVFSSIPLTLLKQHNSGTNYVGLSSQGASRERNFYWNGTGITFCGGNSLGVTKIYYLY